MLAGCGCRCASLRASLRVSLRVSLLSLSRSCALFLHICASFFAPSISVLGRRKPVTDKVIRALKAESKTAAAAGADDTCCLCEAKWSVFEKHANEYSLSFQTCTVCHKGVCCFCCPTTASLTAHEGACKNMLLVSKMVLQQQQTIQKLESGKKSQC